MRRLGSFLVLALAATGCSHGKSSTREASAAPQAQAGTMAATCPVAIPNTTVREEDTASGAALVFTAKNDKDVSALQQSVQNMSQMHNQRMQARMQWRSQRRSSAGYGQPPSERGGTVMPPSERGGAVIPPSGEERGETQPESTEPGESGGYGTGSTTPGGGSGQTESAEPNPTYGYGTGSGGAEDYETGTGPSEAPTGGYGEQPESGYGTGQQQGEYGEQPESGYGTGQQQGQYGQQPESGYGQQPGGYGTGPGTGSYGGGMGGGMGMHHMMMPMMDATTRVENTSNGARLVYDSGSQGDVQALRQAVRMAAQNMQSGRCPPNLMAPSGQGGYGQPQQQGGWGQPGQQQQGGWGQEQGEQQEQGGWGNTQPEDKSQPSQMSPDTRREGAGTQQP